MKELSHYLKHSNQTHLSLNSISTVTNSLLISFSLNTANNIGIKAVIKLSEALKHISHCTRSAVTACILLLHFVLINTTDNNIGNEGAIKLFEAVKSNKCLE
jgi:hypothetical protein